MHGPPNSNDTKNELRHFFISSLKQNHNKHFIDKILVYISLIKSIPMIQITAIPPIFIVHQVSSKS